MIIPNGVIQPKYKTGGGLDPNTGFPIPSIETWGEPIKCQFVQNFKRHNFHYSNGEVYEVYKYLILVEEYDWKWDSEQIKLTTKFGRVVGEFQIIKTEHLKAVGQVAMTI